MVIELVPLLTFTLKVVRRKILGGNTEEFYNPLTTYKRRSTWVLLIIQRKLTRYLLWCLTNTRRERQTKKEDLRSGEAIARLLGCESSFNNGTETQKIPARKYGKRFNCVVEHIFPQCTRDY